MPKRDPQIDAHLEWIGFVRPTGLVVSAAALVRAGAVRRATIPAWSATRGRDLSSVAC
jgi:hypothetical protein